MSSGFIHDVACNNSGNGWNKAFSTHCTVSVNIFLADSFSKEEYIFAQRGYKLSDLIVQCVWK